MTATLAKPARVTATCAVVLSASFAPTIAWIGQAKLSVNPSTLAFRCFFTWTPSEALALQSDSLRDRRIDPFCKELLFLFLWELPFDQGPLLGIVIDRAHRPEGPARRGVDGK